MNNEAQEIIERFEREEQELSSNDEDFEPKIKSPPTGTSEAVHKAHIDYNPKFVDDEIYNFIKGIVDKSLANYLYKEINMINNGR